MVGVVVQQKRIQFWCSVVDGIGRWYILFKNSMSGTLTLFLGMML